MTVSLRAEDMEQTLENAYLLANSDAVYRQVLKYGPPHGAYIATPVHDKNSPQLSGLPFIYLDAFSTTPKQAVTLARRASKALITYLGREQSTAGIPQSQRVAVQVASTATGATLSTWLVSILTTRSKPMMSGRLATCCSPISTVW